MRALEVGSLTAQIAVAFALYRWFPISAYAWCFGMFVTLVTNTCKRLGVKLPWVHDNDDDPFFGLGRGLAQHVDHTMTRTGIIFAAWSMPLFAYAAYASPDVVWLTALLAVIVTIAAVVARL